MLAITIVYLVGELSFSAWLLDILASNTDNHTQERAESLGRLVSGIAVALLIWPLVVGSSLRYWKAYVSLIVLSFGIIWGVFHSEKALIDQIVNSSTADQRAAALSGSLLRQRLLAGGLEDEALGGIWNPRNADSIAGKAFVGVVAFLAVSSAKTQSEVERAAPNMIRSVVDRRFGGVAGELARFEGSQRQILERFVEYQAGHAAYQSEVVGAAEKADAAWEDYLDELGRRHKLWGRPQLPGQQYAWRDGSLGVKQAWPRIREAVRERGVPVPESWNTGDKATFLRLAKQALIEAASAKWLHGLQPNLALSSYANHPLTQQRWIEALGYPKTVNSLSLDKIQSAVFERMVYSKVLDQRVAGELVDYQRIQGGKWLTSSNKQQAKDAYAAMVTPVLALTLSLLGALVHLLKALLLAAQAATGWHLRSTTIKAGVIGMAMISAFAAAHFFIETDLTSHKTYLVWLSPDQAASSSTGGAWNHFLACVVDAMIKMQSIAYPAFEMVRVVFTPVLALLNKSGLESVVMSFLQ